MPHPARGLHDASDDDVVQFLGPTDEVEESPEPRFCRSNLLLGAAALMLAAALVVTGRIHDRNPVAQPHHRVGGTHAPAATRAPDLALAQLRGYTVSEVAVSSTRQELWVDYEPTPTTRYAGGTITLYASRDFDPRSFVMAARRTVVAGHVAYVGPYRHQLSVAWPVRDDRWVCLSGFIGAGNGTDPEVSRAAELAVAPSVLVR